MNLYVNKHVPVPTYQYLVGYSLLGNILQHAVAWIHTPFSDTAALFFAISFKQKLVLVPMTLVGSCTVASSFCPTLIQSDSCQMSMLAISYVGSPAVQAL